MVFYLKYRPQTLSELDNQRVAELIGRYLARSEKTHAFLFTGSKGTGKTSTARILAKSLNCLKPHKGQACGTCTACISIAKGENLDILEIDAASNRGIDEIRELREKIKFSPTHLKYKVYIIDEVHMLTTEAFNALLKTLEEPPAHAVFVLATTEVHKIPDTISSRCVRIDFHKATDEEIVHSLKRIVLGEKLDVEDTALFEIAHAADGSFRDAAKLLEELSINGTKISHAAVTLHLGLTDVTFKQQFMEFLLKKDARQLLQRIQKMVKDGNNTTQFFTSLLLDLQRELVCLVTGEKSEWQQKDLLSLITRLSEAFPQLKTAVIPTLPFELVIIEYCTQPSSVRPVAQTTTPAAASIPVMQTSGEVDTSSAAPVTAKWVELLEQLKSANHSIVGVLRSCRPITLSDGTLTIEARYKFHAERLADLKVQELIGKAVKDVVGLDVKIQTVLKKK